MKSYNSVAISLHWLIAFVLLGLLAIGKYMTGLDEADPLRYTLTQWHKSFGIMLLLLALVRIVWRVTHKPPALPESSTVFERFASHATHMAMYLLMVVIPVSGWVMVSASPLNLKTELFWLIPWPHIGFIADTSIKTAIAERSVDVHEWLANTMIVLVLLHTAAALFHQFIKKDQLLLRMFISSAHRHRNDVNHGLVMGLCMALAGGLFLSNVSSQASLVSGAGFVAAQSATTESQEQAATSSVGFTATQLGEPVVGRFEDTLVQLSLYEDQLEKSVLNATVMTGSVKSSDSQIDSTVVTADWFASDEYPQATFASASFESLNATSYIVAGDLMIKGTSKPVSFELTLKEGVGSGEFEINRNDYGVGDKGQDEFVGEEVVIRFEAQNSVQ